MKSKTLGRAIFLGCVLTATAALLLSCGGKSDKPVASKQPSEPFQGLVTNPPGDMASEESRYQGLLAKDPKNTTVLFNLAAVEVKSGKSQLAEGYYGQAIAADPNFAAAYFGLGSLRLASGSRQEAIDLFRKAVEIDQNFAEAYLNLGALLLQDGKTAEGQAFLSKAMDLNSKRPPVTPTVKP